MVIRNDFHSLLDQLVTLVFELFLVAELPGIDTATEVVVLRRRRWRPIKPLIGLGDNAFGEGAHLSPSAGTTSSILSF
jgi:hypothetical protein